jgi:cytochrome c peroxidase
LPLVAEVLPDDQEVRDLLRLWDLLPLSIIPATNLNTSAKIELGRHVLYDYRLSVKQRQACSSCYQQGLGFVDDRVLSRGSTGQILRHNSQGLANVAYFPTLTCSRHELLELEHPLLAPLTADEAIEFGLTPKNESEIPGQLLIDSDYSAWFAEAFPGENQSPTVDQISRTLASFMRFLVSGEGHLDRFLLGEETALTKRQ